jgi:hypothetical protein
MFGGHDVLRNHDGATGDMCDDANGSALEADKSSRLSRSGSARMSISTTLSPPIVKPITEKQAPIRRPPAEKY